MLHLVGLIMLLITLEAIILAILGRGLDDICVDDLNSGVKWIVYINLFLVWVGSAIWLLLK